MVASRKEAAGLLEIPGSAEKALRVAAIYGANASGKSNVIKALQFMDLAVATSYRSWEPTSGVPVDQFRGNSDTEPSEFVLDFLVEGVQHQFGFIATATRIESEWLGRRVKGRSQLLYDRDKDAVKFGRIFRGENATIARLMRPNSLFLSTAAQNNHEAVAPIYGWFRDRLKYVFEKNLVACLETVSACSDEIAREQIAALLKGADFGIVGLQHGRRQVNPEQQTLVSAILQVVSGGKANSLPNEDRLAQERPTLKLIHTLKGQPTAFDLKDESNGTIAFVSLLGPMTKTLASGGTLLIDEIDSGLHPAMVAHLVGIFEDPATNPGGAQLIFNTHDSTLLNSGLLQRDQIWFTEKDRAGESRLYPLTDFKPRKDENFERGYLVGRYGAVPYLSPSPFLELLHKNEAL